MAGLRLSFGSSFSFLSLYLKNTKLALVIVPTFFEEITNVFNGMRISTGEKLDKKNQGLGIRKARAKAKATALTQRPQSLKPSFAKEGEDNGTMDCFAPISCLLLKDSKVAYTNRQTFFGGYRQCCQGYAGFAHARGLDEENRGQRNRG
jgi:hypothetical protein